MNLLSNLSLKTKSYVEKTVQLCKENDVDLVSLIVFGSIVKGNFLEDVSDVDMILIIADETPKKSVRKLRKDMMKLEFNYGFRKTSQAFFDIVFKTAEHITGMFISHFICYRKDFLDAKFTKVFNVNPALAFLLAPKTIVWASTITSAQTIIGKNLLKIVPLPPVNKKDVLKSNVMNSFLSLAACLAYPFHPDATKFAMEALKWSLLTCYFCYKKKSSTIEDIIKFFQDHSFNDPLFQEMLSLREKYKKSFLFTVKSGRIVRRLHRMTIKENQFPIIITKHAITK